VKNYQKSGRGTFEGKGCTVSKEGEFLWVSLNINHNLLAINLSILQHCPLRRECSKRGMCRGLHRKTRDGNDRVQSISEGRVNLHNQQVCWWSSDT
jgi:hypothetical protein